MHILSGFALVLMRFTLDSNHIYSMKSILSEVVGKHAKQIENICSESLALIINDSPSAQAAFREYVLRSSANTINLNEKMLISSQVTSKRDTSIPDLNINDGSNETYLLEAKFWAGLTEHQPNTYLKRIASTGGALLFLAPERRVPSLKNEVASKMELAGIGYNVHGEGFVVGQVHIFFLCWGALLNALWTSATNASDQTSLHNLFQLKALVDKIDSEAFLPFEHQLFTPAAGTQRDQMVDLLDMLVDSNKNIFDTAKLTYGGGKYTYQRFFKLFKKYGGYMLYSSSLWKKYNETPIFICLSTISWGKDEELAEMPQFEYALKSEGIKHYTYEVINTNYPALVIPLFVKTGVSKEVVYQDLQGQLEHIAETLKISGTS